MRRLLSPIGWRGLLLAVGVVALAAHATGSVAPPNAQTGSAFAPSTAAPFNQFHAQTKETGTVSAPTRLLLAVTLPDRPMNGLRIFGQKGCIRCHALGSGGARIGPSLARIVVSGSALDLAGAFWNHAPVMREKMKELKIDPAPMTSGDMADIIAILTLYRHHPVDAGQPGAPATGQRVFTAKGCAGCHSDSETVRGLRGPSLRSYQSSDSALLLVQAMWNHSAEMGATMQQEGVEWPRLTGREMVDLIAYVMRGEVGVGLEGVRFEPGSPRRGRELFASKGCTACHSTGNAGRRSGPDLAERAMALGGSVAALAAAMWNHSQGMLSEFRRRGIPRATFSGQEMVDIVAYLYFVNYVNVWASPVQGQRIFDQKCSACHARGPGGPGPDLTTRRLDEPLEVIAAMWNHAAQMDTALRQRGLPWPRFEPGEAADLTAFLVAQR